MGAADLETGHEPWTLTAAVDFACAGRQVQPILAWGYMGATYTMFNGVFDWTE